MFMKRILLFALVIIVIVIGLAIGLSKRAMAPGSSKNITNAPSNNSTQSIDQNSESHSAISTPKSELAEPVTNFKARVTKKPFGIYITPQNSPISPERFTGYHTGADAEYTDISADVPVYAVADGKVVLSRTASGYGGVFMLEITLDSTKLTVLYGHIRPSSLPKVGTSVTKGEHIGLLGAGYSSETDGERRHLHFAILSDNSLNIKGYVSNKSDLSSWINPLKYF